MAGVKLNFEGAVGRNFKAEPATRRVKGAGLAAYEFAVRLTCPRCRRIVAVAAVKGGGANLALHDPARRRPWRDLYPEFDPAVALSCPQAGCSWASTYSVDQLRNLVIDANERWMDERGTVPVAPKIEAPAPG